MLWNDMFLIYKLKKYLQGFCFLCTFVASLLKSGFNKKEYQYNLYSTFLIYKNSSKH